MQNKAIFFENVNEFSRKALSANRYFGNFFIGISYRYQNAIFLSLKSALAGARGLILEDPHPSGVDPRWGKTPAGVGVKNISRG